MVKVLVLDQSSSINDYNQALYSNMGQRESLKFFSISKIEIKNVKQLEFKYKIINFLFFTFNLIRLLNRHKINIIHWHWVQVFLLSFIINLICKLKGIKIIYTAHNTNPFHGQKSLKFYLQSFGFNIFLNSCDKIIVHNKYSAKKIFSDSRNIRIIPHGLLSFGKIDLENIKKSHLNSSTFLFFGKIENYKGLDRLIPHIEKMLYVFDNIKITIAGKPGKTDPKLIDRLRKVEERCTRLKLIFKYIDKKHAHQLFSKSRILFLPYKHIDDSGVLSIAKNYTLPCAISSLNGFFASGLSNENSFILKDYDENSWFKLVQDSMNSIIYNKKVYHLSKLKDKSEDWRAIAKSTMSIYVN